MLVQRHLLHALEDLLVEDYKKFKWFLSLKVLDDCAPIRKSHLHTSPLYGTVFMMIEAYGEESAVSLTLEILKQMNFNGIAEELRKAFAAERTASPSASSPAVAPSAGAIVQCSAVDDESQSIALFCFPLCCICIFLRTAKRTASPSASSPAVAPSAAAPGAPVTMMAQQNAVICAPNIKNSYINKLNIIIKKDS